MPSVFKRFVEIGRVALINFARNNGKLCVIVDVADQNRVLVVGPRVHRQIISVRRIALTDFKITIVRGAKSPAVLKAFTEEKVKERFGNTSWSKKIEAKKTKKNLNDFQRFIAKKNLKTRSYKVRSLLSAERAAAKASA